MTAQPLVSVCMPTRNQAGFIGAAIRSALGQTLTDLELIVYDDASTDATAAVVGAVDDRRLRFFRHPRRRGIAGNRNSCLLEARGRYIAWLDSDDVYHQDALERQIACLERNPSAAFAHAAFEVLDEHGERLPDWPLPFESDTVERGVDAFHELIACNYVTAPTVVVRRAAHERVGPYATEVGASSTDWDMWLRLALVGDVAYCAQPVAAYRQHPASTSAVTSASGERRDSDAAVVRRALRSASGLADRSRARRLGRAGLAVRALLRAGDLLTLGRGVGSVRAVLAALRHEPLLVRGSSATQLLAGVAARDDYRAYRAAKALLARLHQRLAGTRYAERLSKVALDDPAWEGTLAEIAATVDRMLPSHARPAVIDKWDPTVIRLSGRKGVHFPNRRLMPDGYPRDSGAAVAHLERLRADGVDHLVVPCSAFWWLEHYPAFKEHLQRYTHIWGDERCVIYSLGCVP